MRQFNFLKYAVWLDICFESGKRSTLRVSFIMDEDWFINHTNTLIIFLNIGVKAILVIKFLLNIKIDF